MKEKIGARESILKKRAELLSKPLKEEKSDLHLLEILPFHLEAETYGIETVFVREVYPLRDYTRLPCVPPFVFGVITVRRRILMVIDLKELFSLPHDNNEEKKVIVLAGQQKLAQKSFGLLCEGVDAIQRIPLESIEPAPQTLTGIKQDFLRGITRERLVLLDGLKLLSSPALVIDETVEAS